MKCQRALVLAGLIIVPLEMTPVIAQTLEEITVTARKREESILRVPVVVTAFNKDLLEQFQTNDLYTVANRVPGFLMGESVGTVGIQASLRGIGPTSQTATVDQSVSLNIDGLPLTQGYAYTAGMFGVGQVEVMKGPQALFYGKNSTAGVIALRSADPAEEPELVVRGGYEFNAEEILTEVIASGPVSDSVKLRLAARYAGMEGYFKNNGQPLPGLGNLPPRHREFAPRENWIVRATALFEPNDRYQARLKFTFSEDRMEGSGGDGQLVFCPDGTGGVPPANISFIGDSDCRLDRYTQLADFDPDFWPGIRNKGVPFMDARQAFGTLEQNIHFTPEYTLTSLTGLYDIRQDNLIRGSGSSNPTIAADFTFENQQFTQEFRLTSDFTDSPVNFMAGAFYQDAEMQVQNRLRGNTALRLPALLQSGLHTIDIESTSVFGQLIWQLTDRVEIAGGARWTDEERTHKLINDLQGGARVPQVTPRIRSTNLSPEVSATFFASDNLTLFAAYRQGFKSGSFNTVSVLDATTPADFDDEKVEGGEIGLKSRWLDGRVVLNAAVYHYRYSDLQVGATELSDTGDILLRTINAASARVRGVELDLSYGSALIQGLTLHGGLNYNHARYTEFTNATCGNGQTISEGCDQQFDPVSGRYTSQDLSGRPLVRAPDWTATFGLDYRMALHNGATLSFGTNTTYSSEFYTNLVALREYQQDSYFKTSANITLSGPADKWELALIGNNLEDRITAGSCSNSNTQNGSILGGQIAGGPTKGPAGSDELGCIAERGREVWLRFTWRL